MNQVKTTTNSPIKDPNAKKYFAKNVPSKIDPNVDQNTSRFTKAAINRRKDTAGKKKSDSPSKKSKLDSEVNRTTNTALDNDRSEIAQKATESMTKPTVQEKFKLAPTLQDRKTLYLTKETKNPKSEGEFNRIEAVGPPNILQETEKVTKGVYLELDPISKVDGMVVEESIRFPDTQLLPPVSVKQDEIKSKRSDELIKSMNLKVNVGDADKNGYERMEPLNKDLNSNKEYSERGRIPKNKAPILQSQKIIVKSKNVNEPLRNSMKEKTVPQIAAVPKNQMESKTTSLTTTENKTANGKGRKRKICKIIVIVMVVICIAAGVTCFVLWYTGFL